MRLPGGPELAILGRPMWERCSFAMSGDQPAAALQGDVVTLAPLDPPTPPALGDTPFTGGFAGPAFDCHGRFFHPRPEDGALDYVVWGKQTALNVVADPPHPFDITGAATESVDFAPAQALPKRPIALACDEADYLYVADAGDEPALWLVDIWQREVARRIALPAPPRDVAMDDGRAHVLVAQPDGSEPGWVAASPCDPPRRLPWPAGLPAADRLAMARGRALVLVAAGTAEAEIAALDGRSDPRRVPFATDLLADPTPDGLLVTVARRPGEEFRRFLLAGRSLAPHAALQAPGYDGRGIARAPDGRIAYWTARGLRHAAPARTRYATEATLLGFALDSERDGNPWGRILMEACVPEGTRVTLRCFTRDDLDMPDPATRVAPAGETLDAIPDPGLTPLPSVLALTVAPPPEQALHRDASPPPLAPGADPPFLTFDAPVIAPPGRFLWLVVTLRGNGARTPRLRGIRVETQDHGLLRQLPRVLWRDPRARDFLGPYLANPAALLAEWRKAEALRHRILDPRVAPKESLDWLASLVGLAMDPCWPEAARRRMIAEASALFRIRGTPRGLCRMLEILTGGQVLIIERFRLRGGGVVGNAAPAESRGVLGAGWRVGGAIGVQEATALDGAEAPETAAHRFTVLLVARLTEEQLACARRLVETHKPAHTLFDLCTVEAGSRVGVGLHVGLASAIGRGAAFGRLTLGESALGRGDLLGRPALDRPAPDGWSAAL
ncbi:phage tail protein [Falsiroseomonas sp. HW251]|uniref:phage tail protein n=1 Tax=Falsiroseomonas sp. HW251 TaxID=3390998 RepID=UPI003D315831